MEYNEKALSIWEKVLPVDHPDLARSYNNLAVTYGALGEHRKRLEYNEKSPFYLGKSVAFGSS
ncbi:MAG: tetratricopeptide repeat protein [Lewinellaceae bacterium]|nr:tetratricopeptide repeat protein [Lewinellaceae bacterium]